MQKNTFGRARRLHPVLVAAAVALITFCAMGIAALTGLVPEATSAAARALSATPPPDGSAPERAGARPIIPCPACGVVDTIRAVLVQGEASGVGAVAGGVTGALVGNRFGKGGGRDAMTVLAGVGGAVAGHAIEKNARQRTVYRVTVRMDDGSFRTISQSHTPSVAVGSRVRIDNGALVVLS